MVHEFDASDMTDVFPQDVEGLPDALPSVLVDLDDGDLLEMRIGPVRNSIGSDEVRMLAYNGSIPGPAFKVRQGTTVSVKVTNDAGLPQTVHWHGLRLENRFDGVPYETQEPISVGGTFTYRLQFPDPGLYWYHPHIREDYGQELGLYGQILVEPAAPDYWPPVNRDIMLTLDDLLLEDGRIPVFHPSGPNTHHDGTLRKYPPRQRPDLSHLRCHAGRSRTALLDQHREYAALQHRRGRRKAETCRR